jgi:hypothetical protein
MASQPQPQANELLKHFDGETAKLLGSRLKDGLITDQHIREIIRLTAALPDYREAEEIESLLEDAEDMDGDAFKAWVDQIIKEAREG